MNSYTDSDIRLSNFNFNKDENTEEEFINKYPGNDFSDKVNDVKVFVYLKCI